LVVGRSIEKSQTWIGEKAEQLKGNEAEAEQCGAIRQMIGKLLACACRCGFYHDGLRTV
jgi:hypothetical protein